MSCFFRLKFFFCCIFFFFFFKQKTAYEMRISDWSSDVCSSDLFSRSSTDTETTLMLSSANLSAARAKAASWSLQNGHQEPRWNRITPNPPARSPGRWILPPPVRAKVRSEEHTSELQSLMRISYAVFCLKNKKKKQ